MAQNGNFVVDWQSNPEWRTGRIKPANMQEIKKLWVFALFLNLIVQFTWFGVFGLIMQQGSWGKGLLLSLFPLGGLWLLWYTVRKQLQTNAIATALLRLATCPGIIGAPLKGIIELPPSFQRGRQFAVTLSCRKVEKIKRDTSEEELWSEKQVVLAVPGPRGAQLSFAFVVPTEQPHSSDTSFPIFYRWYVCVTETTATDDLDISFPVPLLPAPVNTPPTAVSSNGAAISQPPVSAPPAPIFTPAPSLPSPAVASDTLADLLRQVAQNVLTIEAGNDRLLFRYSSTRFLLPGFYLIVFAAIFLFGPLLKSSRYDLFELLFPSGVGVLFLLGAIYFIGNTLTVEAKSTELEVIHRVLGIRVKYYRVPVSSLKSILVRGDGEAWVGNGTVFYYKVVLRLKSGGRITVGNGIKGQVNARLIARIFEQKYGLQKTAIRAEPMVPMA